MSDSPKGNLFSANRFPRRILRTGVSIGFVLTAGLFFLVAVSRLTQLWLIPEITIAVPAMETGYEAVFSQLSRVADAATLEVKVQIVDGMAAVEQALDRREADFGVIRPDRVLPKGGLTVARLHDDIVVMVKFDQAPSEKAAARPAKRAPAKKAAEESDIPQPPITSQRIGIFSKNGPDTAAVRQLLLVYGVPETAIAAIDGTPDAIGEAIASDRVDVVAMIGTADDLRGWLNSVTKLNPTILPLKITSLAATLPAFTQVTLPANSLSGSLRSEEVETAALSWRLVARADVERATVAALLHAVYSKRLELASASHLAWSIRGVPDDDATFAKFPNHRGALDYYNREQQTFMDLYGDWLWLGLFAAGGVSSAMAWLMQMLSRRRKVLVEHILDRLLELLSEARIATNEARLGELTMEVDALVTHAVRQARWRALDPIATAAVTLAIDSTRSAISDQRDLVWRNNGRARA